MATKPKKTKRGLEALLASTEFPFEISPTAEARVKIALQGLEIVLSAQQCASVAVGFEATAKFGPKGDQLAVLLSPACQLIVPRAAGPEMARRLRIAAEYASQWQPE